MRALTLVGASLCVSLLGAPAAADVAPPPDYVESCTVANQQKPGLECISCGEAYFEKPDACEKHASDGYQQRCRTAGASTWDEVWCRQGTASSPMPTPGPEKSGSCGACDLGSRPSGGGALSALLLAASLLCGRRGARRPAR